MKITHLGHACLLVETAQSRLLIDPGNFSTGYDELTDLDAILVTHQHPDHFDPERAPALLKANPGARAMIEPEAVTALELDASAFGPDDTATVGDLTITGVGGRHATIHDQVPVIGNVGLLVTESGGATLFHPGDSYATTPAGVDILAFPLTAPWTKISETLDFLRAVAATTAIPIHDAGASPGGRGLYLSHASNFSPDATEVIDLSSDPREF